MTTKKTRLSVYFFSLFIILNLLINFQCTGNNNSGDNPSKDSKPIRFAYQNRIGSAPCIIAVRKAFFKDAGLNVTPFQFNSGPVCAEALFSGSADIGTMGDATAVIACSRDSSFVIIASHSYGEHRHRLVVKRDSRYKSISDLIGEKIGVKKGTSTYAGLLAFLFSKHIKPTEIQLLDIKPSEMTDALLSGAIQGFVASEPDPSMAEAKGAREIATMGNLGNRYPILILTRQDRIVSRRDDFHFFLQAIKKAIRYINENPKETAEIVAEVTGLSPDIVMKAMKRHIYYLNLNPEIVFSLKKTAEFLLDQKRIDTFPDFERVVNNSLLAEKASI